MTDTDLLKLRRAARRDNDLSDSAARLFSEITDLTMLEDGCTASATQLGAWLGMSERTIRRRRDELIDTGYLRIKPAQSARKLVPVKSDGQDCPTQTSDNSDRKSRMTDKSGQNRVDKSGQHKENKNTHERGRAGAHGEGGDEDEQTTVEERFEKLVTIWRQTSGTPPLNAKREETFYRWADDEVITEWDTYQKVLRREAEITQERDVNLALAYLREEYENEVESGVLSPERQEDPNWTVENGEKHFKGVPLSEIGCKNYYTGETA